MISTVIKRLKSKTYWLAILVVISAQLPLLQDMLAENYGIVSTAIAILIAVLREATKTPVKEK